MLAFRIVLAGATAVLMAPAAAFATNADGATPSATPLLVEIAVAVAAAVAVGLLARRRVAHLVRAGRSRLAEWRAGPAGHSPRADRRAVTVMRTSRAIPQSGVKW